MKLFVICFLILALPTLSYSDEFIGQVIEITDGDTISVLASNNPMKVRLHGIVSPEITQPYGTEAKLFVSDVVLKKEVVVIPKEIDRFGRHMGIVILPDDKILNDEIVKAGFAWWDKEQTPNDLLLEYLGSI